MHQRSLLAEGFISDALKADEQADLPLTFPTILADPPWDVLQRSSRGAHRHYPLMTPEHIAALPVDSLSSANSHLWLWVTNATLFAGHVVMEAWGFKYRSCLTWVKPGLGLAPTSVTIPSTYYSAPKEGHRSCIAVSRRGYLRRSKAIATSQRSNTPLRDIHLTGGAQVARAGPSWVTCFLPGTMSDRGDVAPLN